MICQKCKNAAASICVSQVVDSQKTDIYLCQNCANEVAAAQLKAALGFLGAMHGNLVFGVEQAPLTARPGGENSDNRDNYERRERLGICDSCGITFEEIQKAGKLGCADCYRTFRANLRPIIMRIHRSAQHRGKSPSLAAEPAEPAGEAAAEAAAKAAAEAAGVPGQNGEGTSAGPAGSVADDFTERLKSGAETVKKANNRLNALKTALTLAIRDEEYEKAAVLRDQIKELEATSRE